MSTSLRNIEYYGLYFHNKKEDYKDPEKLNEIISSLGNSYIYDDTKTNKFWRLDSKSSEGNIFKLVFKSAKYNHSPNYISRINGNERTSDKALDEGECEKTHLVIDVNTSTLIIESRKSGISAFNVVKYINSHCKKNNLNFPSLKVFKELNNDLFNNLNSLKRVHSAEFYVENDIIGSSFMNLIEPTEELQEEVIITLKAKRKKSLPIREIAEFFKKIGIKGEKTKRIRVKGTDEDDISVLLDSLNQYKLEKIHVELNSDGTVNTNSIFDRMTQLL